MPENLSVPGQPAEPSSKEPKTFFTETLSLSPQTHLTFGKEFTEAVEMKQVAQQEAERARFVVEKVRASKWNSPVYGLKH